MREIYGQICVANAGINRLAQQMNFMISEQAAMKTMLQQSCHANHKSTGSKKGKLILSGLLFMAGTWLLDTDLKSLTEFLNALRKILEIIL